MAETSRESRSESTGSLFNGSQFTEGIVSALVALIVLIGLVSSLPGGEIQRVLMPAVKPIAVATGLDQRWTMFAPDPPRQVEDLEVHVALADGRNLVWTPPQSDGRAVGVATSPRWRKLKETLVTEKEVRAQLAHWVIGELTGADERAVRVQIILRTKDLSPPGASGPGPTGIETIYDENLVSTR